MTKRSVPEWIGATPDTKIPKRVMLRVFERYEGKCHWTGRKITPQDQWDCDHVKALANGGINCESNLAPILRGKPHKEKTALDVAEKSKTERIRKKHLGIEKSAYHWPKRQFQKRPKRHQTKEQPNE